MYTKTIPHKNFKGRPVNQEVNFNLTEHEVLKLLVEFKSIFDWQERIAKRDPEGETPTEEVVEFYTNFEEILLSSWGELSEDGNHFRKGGRYDFAESSVFHAAMKLFLEDQEEVNKLLNGLMPEGLQDLVKKAADTDLQALADKAKSQALPTGSRDADADEVARLERQLEEARRNNS